MELIPVLVLSGFAAMVLTGFVLIAVATFTDW